MRTGIDDEKLQIHTLSYCFLGVRHLFSGPLPSNRAPVVKSAKNTLPSLPNLKCFSVIIKHKFEAICVILSARKKMNMIINIQRTFREEKLQHKKDIVLV